MNIAKANTRPSARGGPVTMNSHGAAITTSGYTGGPVDMQARRSNEQPPLRKAARTNAYSLVQIAYLKNDLLQKAKAQGVGHDHEAFEQRFSREMEHLRQQVAKTKHSDAFYNFFERVRKNTLKQIALDPECIDALKNWNGGLSKEEKRGLLKKILRTQFQEASLQTSFSIQPIDVYIRETPKKTSQGFANPRFLRGLFKGTVYTEAREHHIDVNLHLDAMHQDVAEAINTIMHEGVHAISIQMARAANSPEGATNILSDDAALIRNLQDSQAYLPCIFGDLYREQFFEAIAHDEGDAYEEGIREILGQHALQPA